MHQGHYAYAHTYACVHRADLDTTGFYTSEYQDWVRRVLRQGPLTAWVAYEPGLLRLYVGWCGLGIISQIVCGMVGIG